MEWARGDWEEEDIGKDMVYKELKAIIYAVMIFGEKISGKQFKVRCDNFEMVLNVRKGTTKRKDIMHLLRVLHVLMAKFSCYIWLEHIPRCENELADMLSKNEVAKFKTHFPEANEKSALSAGEKLFLALPLSGGRPVP